MAQHAHPIDHTALTALAQRLVCTPSTSGAEGPLAEIVAEEMRQAGFEEVRVDRMGNVIGRLGDGRGKTLVYDAHLDTVDIGERAHWARDPLGGEIEGGVLYGRGACDMKGALAAMLHGCRALVAGGTRLAGTLYLVCVVQEEPCEGAAMRHVVEVEGLRPDWVVLGEPTNLQLARGQRGRIEFEVTVRGRAAHASAPQRGVNAIYNAARVIVGLELLAPQLNADSFLGKGSIAVTEIASLAGSRNAVPDACTLVVDRRLTNGETEAKATAEIKRILARESVDASIRVPEYCVPSYTGYEVCARQHFPYWATPANDPLLTAASGVVEDVLGYVPHLGKWEFSTDGVYTAGVAGIPTIGFGPGEERYAHTTEDQVRLDDLASAAQVYAQLAARLLRG
jgi:putative selenium metabolism hydrolase